MIKWNGKQIKTEQDFCDALDLTKEYLDQIAALEARLTERDEELWAVETAALNYLHAADVSKVVLMRLECNEDVFPNEVGMAGYFHTRTRNTLRTALLKNDDALIKCSHQWEIPMSINQQFCVKCGLARARFEQAAE